MAREYRVHNRWELLGFLNTIHLRNNHKIKVARQVTVREVKFLTKCSSADTVPTSYKLCHSLVRSGSYSQEAEG